MPPRDWLRELEAHGAITRRPAAEEAKLREPMRCPYTARALANMPALKALVASGAFQRLARREGGEDVVT